MHQGNEDAALCACLFLSNIALSCIALSCITHEDVQEQGPPVEEQGGADSGAQAREYEGGAVRVVARGGREGAADRHHSDRVLKHAF